jgi:cysteine-rich repeat protein
MQERNSRRLQRATRGASGLFCVALFGLFAAGGCSEEVGGDGFVPDPPSAGKNGFAGGAGMLGSGGLSEGGAAGEPSISGGRAGSTGRAGTSGKGGRGGTSTMTEGGRGGEPSGPVCGNNMTEPPEECDDGNTKSGDGCTADCRSNCEICEKTYCTAVRAQEAGEYNWSSNAVFPTSKDLFTDCYEMPGVTKMGPAGAGVPLADLCREMVDCIRTEKCAQFVPDDLPLANLEYSTGSQNTFMHCFCSYDVGEPGYLTACKNPDSYDPEKDPNYIGKCKREIQEASELDGVDIFNGLYTLKTKAFGGANNLLQWCDKRLCTEECLPGTSVGVVATIASDILQTKNAAGETPLGDLIADAQRAATATDFAFVNDETFTSEYAPLGLIFHAAPGRPADADGRILESEVRNVLFGIHPQYINKLGGARLVTMKLTGQQVFDFLAAERAAIQVSGLTFTWDASTLQVTEVKKAGTAIDKAASYSVTVNNVLAKSIVGGTDVVATDKNPEQELVKFLQAQPQPIAPPTLDRITRAN